MFLKFSEEIIMDRYKLCVSMSNIKEKDCIEINGDCFFPLKIKRKEKETIINISELKKTDVILEYYDSKKKIVYDISQKKIIPIPKELKKYLHTISKKSMLINKYKIIWDAVNSQTILKNTEHLNENKFAMTEKEYSDWNIYFLEILNGNVDIKKPKIPTNFIGIIKE